MADPEAIIEELCEAIDAKACDSRSLSQQDSIDVYQGVIGHCRDWIETIRSDMDNEDEDEG